MSTAKLTKAINRFKVKKTNKSAIATDSVVGEEPLEIRVQSTGDDSRLAITMRTPGNDLELTAGFLWSEGLLRNREDLISITSCKDPNLTPEEAENVRFFIGYSGWSEGQLADEIEEKSWLVVDDYKPELILNTDNTSIWKRILEKQGAKFRIMTNFPQNPSDN